MDELPRVLSGYSGLGYVVAPAGYGKTHLIASALQHASKRQLVLTHTYAGVNALRRKVRLQQVTETACRIDTIASWALRLCLAYPIASGWTIATPNQQQWTDLYRACSRLLDHEFVRRIVRASYGGLYVDEYQDCSREQHELIVKVARDIPCRILGDPLQGIFDFSDEPIDWHRDIESSFEKVGELDTPHRWRRAGSGPLGDWLRDVRGSLERGEAIELPKHPPVGLNIHLIDRNVAAFSIAQTSACRRIACKATESVIAIHGGDPIHKAKCHRLAKQLGGMYASIDEIEGRDLFSFIKKLDGARTDGMRLRHAVALSLSVMSGVASALAAGTRRGEHVIVRRSTRNPAVAEAANLYLQDPTSANLVAFLTAVKKAPGVQVARADLFNRAIGVLRKHSTNPELTLNQAAERYQIQFRHRGRPVGRRKIIGTTLLVKGLEFDHAIVLDAVSLSRKELYVALTRGAKSLTVISSARVLHPPD